MLLYLFVFVSFGISNVILDRAYHCSSAVNYSEIFRCHNEIDCIDIIHLCDGTMDCADGSDEMHCFNNKASPRGVCILPQYPLYGTYTVLDEPDALPGAAYKFVELSMTCEKGYGVIESDGSVSSNDVHEIICVNGKWSSRIPKCVKSLCTLEADPSVRYMCQIPESPLFKPCERYVPHGTRVDPWCNAPNYYSPKNFLPMTCLNGSWDYIVKCEPDCGRVTSEGVGLIINGTTAKRGELPWHVGIYTKTESPYRQICGGSIVSNDVVISAAHCFWSDLKKQLPASDYAIAAGKLYRQWNSNFDQESQESDVKTILLPERFQGTGFTLQADLAVLVLVTPIVYKIHVKPICLNFEINFDRLQLQNGRNGKVGGWGLIGPDGPPSELLKVVELPYVDYNTCYNSIPQSFQQFITIDKFCAGYTNGTAVCQADSGSGLAFAATDHYTERYYLRGVVSAAPIDENKDCNNENYATFTRITDYSEFIKEAMHKSLKPVEAPLSIEPERQQNSNIIKDQATTRLPPAQIDDTPLDKEFVQPMDVIPPTKRVTREITPWFVDIYGEDFSFPLCFGTIITSQVVFTSAYCMESFAASNMTFTVVAGKLHRTFTDVEGLQNVTVAHTSTYNKHLIPVSNRLFFLKLLRPLIFNSYVKPAIIDFDQALEDSQLQPGSVGKVVGWHSKTEERSYIDFPYEHLDSDVLSLFGPKIQMPTIEINICGGDKADFDQKPYNSGSGYVFTDNSTGTERYYLRGVLSYRVSCWHNACPYRSYIIFVKISYYKNSISQYLKVHNQTVRRVICHQ